MDQPTNPKGRPTVLTPEVKAAILRMLAEGNFLAVACRVAGISRDTVYKQRRRLAGRDSDGERGEFFRLLDRSVAAGEAFALRRVLDGGPGWQSAAWFLQRRHPGRWARKRRSPDSLPVPSKPIGEMTADELDAYAQSLESTPHRSAKPRRGIISLQAHGRPDRVTVGQ